MVFFVSKGGRKVSIDFSPKILETIHCWAPHVDFRGGQVVGSIMDSLSSARGVTRVLRRAGHVCCSLRSVDADDEGRALQQICSRNVTIGQVFYIVVRHLKHPPVEAIS